MTNIVKNYFRVLEVISSLNIELDFKSGIGRKQKMSDIEVRSCNLDTNSEKLSFFAVIFNFVDINIFIIFNI